MTPVERGHQRLDGRCRIGQFLLAIWQRPVQSVGKKSARLGHGGQDAWEFNKENLCSELFESVMDNYYYGMLGDLRS